LSNLNPTTIAALVGAFTALVTAITGLITAFRAHNTSQSNLKTVSKLEPVENELRQIGDERKNGKDGHAVQEKR